MFRSALVRATQLRTAAAGLVARRWYQVGPNSVRPGMVIEHNGSPFIVTSKDHGGTGRGQAVIKLSLKHAVTGARTHERFRGSDSLEVMVLAQNEYQFLYIDGGKAHLMDMQTFEELAMGLDTFEGSKDHLALLEDGMNVVVQVLVPQPGPISWRLPPRHTYRVKSVEARIEKDKGATYVSAELENGAQVKIPSFIKPGESVVINLQDLTYVSRA
ncbi:hypothetical protein IW140_004595 [Coemansia sp. RSA 1813]|nr:hypothetical protein EV178_002172 [Coemansia sp. RSA 1646]KAJ1766044.1 hypothetical protein LPJ74_006082 [Coemansia sp. RSA 1843]KAJ2090328.1 hypothetical protein IW138_002754 [Coemansia sp. RSA 986]KAJ2215518.1 hypothetical protein EV179_002111 [Coemansia sp. RSA 487]KAJ2567170.1 hypothetical protein IW140_004595 [Coemansia sp. RSA 1813]